jgi:hypothetical protein
MSSKIKQPGVPIIGADAELQARMRAEVKTDRLKNVGKRLSNPRISRLEQNQRKQTRYPISNSVIAFPTLESREVATSDALVGIGLDIGSGGIKVLVDAARPHVGLELVVGLEQKTNDYRFCAGVVSSVRQSRGAFEVGIEFKGYMHEVLECEQIVPILDREDMRFSFAYPDGVLASLCRIGAAVSTPLDSILLCPNCRGIPTIRRGCSMCLSSNVKASRMIHHFACANVDFVEAFEHEGELCCQKCRTRRLIVGSDYEYLNGPKVCYDCGQANLEKIEIGHCLSCEHRFAMETAHEMEIVGYRVNRLDILAFLAI